MLVVLAVQFDEILTSKMSKDSIVCGGDNCLASFPSVTNILHSSVVTAGVDRLLDVHVSSLDYIR